MLGTRLAIMTNAFLELVDLSSRTPWSGLGTPRAKMCFG